MSGKVLIIEDLLVPDKLAHQIARFWLDWDMRRTTKVREWEEVQKYVYATDTTKTTNSKLPWSNKTTLPKLCQIRDNLFSNYMASMFPKRKWLVWEGLTKNDEDISKKKAIESYMAWVVDRPEFYSEMAKLVLDYIDYGNCIATVEWQDNSGPIGDQTQSAKVGYVGPVIRRINPVDLLVNPVAPSFAESPKIVRSLVSLGEVKEILEKETFEPGEKEAAQELYQYMKDVRTHVSSFPGNSITKDNIYSVAGFTNFQGYLESNYCEIITFYGNIYNEETEEFQRNQVIRIVDRHKVLSQRTHPSFFGTAPLYHCGWRIRPDNLWAMGPLDNLVGMQYRIDHLENMKADCFDLIAYGPLVIKGYVEPFEWAPMERIYVGDDGDVTMLSPPVQALQADNQIDRLEAIMEEMAGSPKEAMGFRTPGEKTAYEVQRLENAASRIFQNKIGQFERDQTELLLNAMLELARRNLDSTTIRIFDSELKVATFKSLTAQDITGNGRLKPIAARHFAEKAQMVQNLNTFYGSPAFQQVAPHFSSVQAALLWEDLLELEPYNIVEPYIALTEQADAQRIQQSNQEQVAMEGQTPSGLFPGDYDQNAQSMGPGPNGPPGGGGIPPGVPQP